jgi:hypothetical protein
MRLLVQALFVCLSAIIMSAALKLRTMFIIVPIIVLVFGVVALSMKRVSDFVLFGTLVRSIQPPYAISVRRFGTLPPASFRFRLTTDTLVFR